MLFVVRSASSRATVPKALLLIMHAVRMLLGMIVFSAAPVEALCECGYSWTISTISGSTTYIGTDVIETDAIHDKSFLDDTDWKSQNYNISASAARGPYG